MPNTMERVKYWCLSGLSQRSIASLNKLIYPSIFYTYRTFSFRILRRQTVTPPPPCISSAPMQGYRSEVNRNMEHVLKATTPPDHHKQVFMSLKNGNYIQRWCSQHISVWGPALHKRFRAKIYFVTKSKRKFRYFMKNASGFEFHRALVPQIYCFV